MHSYTVLALYLAGNEEIRAKGEEETHLTLSSWLITQVCLASGDGENRPLLLVLQPVFLPLSVIVCCTVNTMTTSH